MEITGSFSERLKEAMGEMSSTKLADALGISKQSISAYLNGVRKPKRIVLSEIAKVLNVNPMWLIGYDVPREAEVPKENKFSAETLEFLSILESFTPEQRKFLLSMLKGMFPEE